VIVRVGEHGTTPPTAVSGVDAKDDIGVTVGATTTVSGSSPFVHDRAPAAPYEYSARRTALVVLDPP
jgi:hypothetical protein